MKNYIIPLLISTILLSVSPLHSQESTEGKSKEGARNLVKLNFDGLFTGRYQFGYERLLGKYTSAQLNVGILFDYEYQESSTTINVIDDYTNGVVISPEFRVYLSEFTSDAPPKGFFVGAFGRYRDYEQQEFRQEEFLYIKTNYDVRTVGVGLHLGFQYFTSFGVGFDAWVGPEFRYRTQGMVQTRRDDFTQELYTDVNNLKVQETVAFAGIGVCYAF